MSWRKGEAWTLGGHQENLEQWGKCRDQRIPAGETSPVPPLPLHRKACSYSGWCPHERVPGLPAGGRAHLVELHVIVLDALPPGVLAVGANVLSLLVP